MLSLQNIMPYTFQIQHDLHENSAYILHQHLWIPLIYYFNICKYSGACYNKCYNERMLQPTVFINKIRMLQRTWRNTIGQDIMRVRTCRAIPLWLERQSSSLLSFVRFSYQFSSVIRESLFIVFTKERLFILFKFTCTMYKS